MSKFSHRLALSGAAVLLGACHGGGGGYGNNNPQTYTVGGTVSGLAGAGLVLQNNAGNNLNVSANGAFAFSTALANGAAYSVTVLTQPSNPSQTCTVTSGSGSVGGANVASVQLACLTNSYSIGGAVSGLDASDTGLVLQNNAGDDLAISSNGAFNFTTSIASGAGYAVTIKTQPSDGPLQNCSVTNGSGTVSNAAVSSVAVTCVTRLAKFLYVTNPGSNNLSAYTINGSTGALTAVAGSPFSTQPSPRYATVDRAGKFLYVACLGSSIDPPRVSAYAINGTTGALTELTASPFDLSTPPPAVGALAIFAAVLHPSGEFGYVPLLPSPGGGALYGATIDASTGNLTPIPGAPVAEVGVTSPTFDPAGKWLFVASNVTSGTIATFQINAPSGVLTAIGAFPTGGANPLAAVPTPDGKFLLVPNYGSGSFAVFAVDAVAGTLSMVGSPFATGPAGTGPSPPTYHRRLNTVYLSNLLYLLSPGPATLAAFKFDTATGAMTPLAGSPYLSNGGLGAALHPSGKFLYQLTPSSLQRFSIEQATGVPTLVADVTNPVDAGPYLLVLDASGKYAYVTNSGAGTVSVYSIDAASGALTLVNTLPSGMASSSARAVPIPVGLQ
jgi:6-phosphogluconolactonase (cycloisomerase 2 family)